MNAMSCFTSNTKTKTCQKIIMLYCVRSVTEVVLDRQYVRCVLRTYLYNCSSLFTCFLSHQVFIFTHVTCFPFTSLKCCWIDDRLDMLYGICIIASPYSLASCLTRFSSIHTCSSFNSPRFYALSKVQHIPSKNAKLSCATTSFP
jgi:hypothetical protein